MKTIITDDDVEAALSGLFDHAGEAAKRRAERIYMEEYRKVVKAEEMAKSNETAVGAQERFAYASDNYKEHLDAMRIAIELDERARFKMQAFTATIEAWRTQESNLRAMGKMQ